MDDFLLMLIKQITLENVFSVAVLILFVRGAWVAVDLLKAFALVIIKKYENGGAQHGQ